MGTYDRLHGAASYSPPRRGGGQQGSGWRGECLAPDLPFVFSPVRDLGTSSERFLWLPLPTGLDPDAQSSPPRVVHRRVASYAPRQQVIHRPASALKEILENSLDAGATSLTVTVKDGGNKLLQVQDNGHGIREEDLPILCQRHTTSKLHSFEDLGTVATFGFRGEALASISFVANLTVTTMTATASHALKASYCDGVLEEGSPRPCAGVPGTTITVENLFYNVITRRRALKSSSEEFSKVLEVIQRYAAMRTDVAFVCRKQGEARPVLHCPVVEERRDRLAAIYGASVARCLTPMRLEISDGGVAKRDSDVCFTLDAMLSSAEYHARKSTFVLFINSRLVECSALKRACEAVYGAILPKAEKPFIFMSLELPPESVDVNVHPTKREVHFLHQEDIIEAIQSAVEEKLIASNGSRTFALGEVRPGFGDDVPGAARAEAAGGRVHETGSSGAIAFATQKLIPGAKQPGGTNHGCEVEGDNADGEGTVRGSKRPKTTARDKVGGDHKLVRTDARAGNLESFLVPRQSGDDGDGSARPSVDTERLDVVRRGARERRGAGAKGGGAEGSATDRFDQAASASTSLPDGQTTELTSVRELWDDVLSSANVALTEIMRRLTLVGAADEPRGLWLIQHGTKLYMVKAREMAKELFYQRVLARFGTHQCQALAEPAPIAEMVEMALEAEEAEEGAGDVTGEDEEGGREQCDKKEVAKAVAVLLAEKAPMLREYFAVDIDEDTCSLVGLPVLLQGHQPSPSGLPEFVLSMAHEVEWNTEKECFRTCAKAIAGFYSDDGEEGAEQVGNGDTAIEASPGDAVLTRSWVMRHVVFPAMSKYLRPSTALCAEGGVTQVACLTQLYRVFERC